MAGLDDCGAAEDRVGFSAWGLAKHSGRALVRRCSAGRLIGIISPGLRDENASGPVNCSFHTDSAEIGANSCMGRREDSKPTSGVPRPVSDGNGLRPGDQGSVNGEREFVLDVPRATVPVSRAMVSRASGLEEREMRGAQIV